MKDYKIKADRLYIKYSIALDSCIIQGICIYNNFKIKRLSEYETNAYNNDII